jgi:2-dehydro-3-deoxygalactonokinase
MPDRTALIGVDWGTTSFRAYRIDVSGAVLDSIASARGILSVTDVDFAAVLAQETNGWAGGAPMPVLMSGMIGSRQGWVEAPYCGVPASLDDIAGALVTVEGKDGTPVSIVPGVALDSGAMPDVMRGEETQIFGALRRGGRSSGIFVLPGTHSKWAFAEDGRIRHFATYMTGEVFAALRGHTILGSLMSEPAEMHEAGFARGLDDGREAGTPGALLHRLFGARTLALFGRMEAEAVADYLSGLLIGAEFADAAGRSGERLVIIGASDLAGRYERAAERFGMEAERADAECTAAGLHAIAHRAGLLRNREAVA